MKYRLDLDSSQNNEPILLQEVHHGALPLLFMPADVCKAAVGVHGAPIGVVRLGGAADQIE